MVNLRELAKEAHKRLIKEAFNHYVALLHNDELPDEKLTVELISAMNHFTNCGNLYVKELKETLVQDMAQDGVYKIKGITVTALLVNPVPSCIVTHPELIASTYPDLMSPPKPNKTEIAKRLRRGETIEGATLSNGGPPTLRITLIEEAFNHYVKGETHAQ
ncbi:hypothetical protein COMNV_00604 [Commensalibacter sp. Nvir]|uniref:siphovirus Gp157 family protein n=1 Tax=Commensalibacter sp. Nvir TaxID=3069817 RepID=UPI002D6C7AF0|nr:hypothetical protein COMNV_00604 [Commensalibacter sp. Nvir]